MPTLIASRRSLVLPALILACVGAGAPAIAHDVSDRAETNLSRLGKVEFKVECAPAMQRDFNRAMALYHSFAWDDAKKAFEGIAKADPGCGMAHWGLAMVLLDNPFIWPGNLPPARMSEIATALADARKAGLKSQREKDYVEAVAIFVRDHEKINHPTRLNAFDDAMGKLAARNPDDTEASIIAALITSANFNPADKTYANQLKAAKVLEPLFVKQPNHPGVAHYLIHSYDYPPIAKQGLAAAKRYAAIAPDAPHALHMPSHIFTRVGHWRDSIKANRASAKAAGDASFDAHHAYDYMVYAHLQLGQDKAARQVQKTSQSMKVIEHFGSAFAYAAMPARMALERSNWKQAAATPLWPKADAYPWSRYPQAEAINAFARGVGAARGGDVAAAKTEHGRLLALRDATKERKLTYWVEQIDIQADLVHALMVVAEGKRDQGIALLRAAAKREDATEKHAVVPGPLLPAREVLADVLLEAGKGPEALGEFEAVLAKEPNRYRAIVGAAHAARLAGDSKKTAAFAAQLAQQTRDSDAAQARKPGNLRKAGSATPARQASYRSAPARPPRIVTAAARSGFDTARFWSRLDWARF